MRLLPNIRFGTERYPDKVARRLRTLNIAVWAAAATHVAYAGMLSFDPARYWWLILLNLASALLYTGIPLLHRAHRFAAPVAATILFNANMVTFVFVLGTGVGIQLYILIGAALAVVYFGSERIDITIASGAVAAGLLILVMAAAPYDTGLIPRWMFVASLVTNAVVSCGILLLIASYALGQAARAETAAEREFERSERLLTNILPAAIAARLKAEKERVIADRHDEASVLFADLAGFTARASEATPEELVQLLNRVFSDFDRLVERHGLEKIKTSGDAYMVVSGVPAARADHARALADLALEMREAAAQWRDPRGRAVPIRMGISSGPVVAGVVGTRKFFYDVWGDAVNVAARMETTGAEGRIQVSEAAWERLRDAFELEPRGEIDIKGKGAMPTWFLLARKAPAAPLAFERG